MKVYRKPLCILHQKLNKDYYNKKANYKSYTPKPYKNSKSTPQAMKLYNALRKKGIKCKLEAYDGYKHVDISIEWAKVNIEVDGRHHIFNPNQLYADIEKDTGSKEDGIRTIRIPNSDIEHNLERGADSIAKVLRKRYREDELF